MKEVFTLQRKYLRIGLFTLATFLAMLVGSLLVMYHDAPSDRRGVAMLFVGLFWSCWTGLAVWVVLAYFRESITLEADAVLFTGVLGKRRLLVADVLRARWRLQPPSVKLFLPGGKQTVWFTNFSAGARVRLIRYFRERVRPEAQEGWSDELERYAAEVAERGSRAEYDNQIQGLFRMLRWTILAGPVVGLACWASLHLYAVHRGVEAPPVVTGWPLVEWPVGGALVGVVVLAGLRMTAWLHRPDS